MRLPLWPADSVIMSQHFAQTRGDQRHTGLRSARGVHLRRVRALALLLTCRKTVHPPYRYMQALVVRISSASPDLECRLDTYGPGRTLGHVRTRGFVMHAMRDSTGVRVPWFLCGACMAVFENVETRDGLEPYRRARFTRCAHALVQGGLLRTPMSKVGTSVATRGQ